jgi:hypothetical protein
MGVTGIGASRQVLSKKLVAKPYMLQATVRPISVDATCRFSYASPPRWCPVYPRYDGTRRILAHPHKRLAPTRCVLLGFRPTHKLCDA